MACKVCGQWPAAADGMRAALPPGCFYYTFADGRPVLVPSACAAHATLAPATGAPLAAAALRVAAPSPYASPRPRPSARPSSS